MGIGRSAQSSAIACGAFAALALFVQCKDPTQIILEVHSDDCANIKDTAVAVGHTVDEVLAKEPDAFAGHDGCEDGSRVGTLTIYPTGAKNEQLAIKIVTAEVGNAALCQQDGNKGCIVQTRTTEFIPGATHRVMVMMSSLCLNLDCGGDKTCIAGKCYSAGEVPTDGGAPTGPGSDASVVDGTAPVDAGDPRCAGCLGACDGTRCDVTCEGSACNGKDVCAPGLPCTIHCGSSNACNNTSCGTANAPLGSCVFDCQGGKNACSHITCNAATCAVTCTAGSGSNATVCDTITLNATGTATLDCNGDNACQNDLTCKGTGDCALACGSNKRGCPFQPRCKCSVSGSNGNACDNNWTQSCAQPPG